MALLVPPPDDELVLLEDVEEVSDRWFQVLASYSVTLTLTETGVLPLPSADCGKPMLTDVVPKALEAGASATLGSRITAGAGGAVLLTAVEPGERVVMGMAGMGIVCATSLTGISCTEGAILGVIVGNLDGYCVA